MDLLQTVRKEGSRGGVDFKWDDVKSSNHRENYLGHSLMAPVGRWQKGRDLNWYAKAGEDASAEDEEQRRKDELRKVKEAEEDAMARALGLPVPDRSANAEPLGERPQLEAREKTDQHTIAAGSISNQGSEYKEGRSARDRHQSRKHRSKDEGRHHERRRSRSYSPEPRSHRHSGRSHRHSPRARSRSEHRSRSRDRQRRRHSHDRDDRRHRRYKDDHHSRPKHDRQRSRSPGSRPARRDSDRRAYDR